jgi:N-acetylglucosamine kinase-like BadF-type ATPase
VSEQSFVGVDAGGTRTRLVLADHQGGLHASVEGGPGDYQRLGAAGVGALITELLQRLQPELVPTVLCAGVAGAGRAPEQQALCGELESRQVAAQILVVSDARAALEGAHGGMAGLVCIAGTGSMVLGRNAAGEEARAGGWGPVLGDQGSAYALVLEGVRRALQAEDGSGEATSLQRDLLEALELSNWTDIVAAVYGSGLSRARLAEACPAIFAAARRGDRVAADIIDVAAYALGAQVGAVARRLRLTAPVAVACTGGVFAEIEILRGPLTRGAGGVALALRPPRLPGCLGALLLAMGEGTVNVPESVISNWIMP